MHVLDRLIRRPRARILVGPTTTTKTFADPADAATEYGWYQRFPWACPQLLDADLDRGVLVIATSPTARDLPRYRPAAELAELLYRLTDAGVSHRDVWPGNILATPNGPRLIDWETAIDQPGYDLYGPDKTGIPIPAIHLAVRSRNSPRGYRMWWNAPHPQSIRNRWHAQLPERRT